MKAIETEYKGYLFRSRLEARWAVFFDSLGLSWEYEPEGFDFEDGTRYLPDFRVRYPGRFAEEIHFEWFEVKPDLTMLTDEEWKKLIAFSGSADRLFVLDGPPSPRMYCTAGEMTGIDSPWVPREEATELHEVAAWKRYDSIDAPEVEGENGHRYKRFIPTPTNLKGFMSFKRPGYSLWCSKGRMWWDEHDQFFTKDYCYDPATTEIVVACEAARRARFGR
jgi:hypothetical protein